MEILRPIMPALEQSLRMTVWVVICKVPLRAMIDIPGLKALKEEDQSQLTISIIHY
jgi:hypothetical protein